MGLEGAKSIQESTTERMGYQIDTLMKQVNEAGKNIKEVDKKLKGEMKDMERNLILRSQVSVSQLDQEELDEARENAMGEIKEEAMAGNAGEGEGGRVEGEPAEQKPKEKTYKDLKVYTIEKFEEIGPLINEKIDEIQERLYKMKLQ